MWKSLIAFVLLLLASCASTPPQPIGQDFNQANLPQLQIGTSRLTDAVALLGAEPWQSAVGKSGALVYTWMYAPGIGGAKHLILVFNQDGTFQRIGAMTGFTLDPATRKRLFVDPAAAQKE